MLLFSYFPPCHDRDKCGCLATMDFELILKESIEILLLSEFLRHSLRKCSPGSLSGSPHGEDFIIALKNSQLVHNLTQRLDLAHVNSLPDWLVFIPGI